LALATTALAALGPASPAGADFTSGKCAGAQAISGNGASFAKGAQEVFNLNFKNGFCLGTPGQGTINVTYTADGSGAGVATMELRNNESRFAGSDDPPTPAQVALMNSGGKKVGEAVEADGVTGNEGKVHVFPIAAGAVAPLVNLPEGCNPEAITDNSFRTVTQAEIGGEAAKKALLRVRFPKTQFEKIWSGAENTKWSDVIPGLAGDTDCEVPIIRVVRFDKSGTTFAFKDYLRTIDPAEGWTSTYENGPGGIGNRQWPGATFGPRDDCGNKNGINEAGVDPNGPGSGLANESDDHLTSGCENGNGGLVKKLIATEGSIGYSDIATARGASPTLAVNAGAGAAPPTPYWTQVQKGSGAFTESTADEANGFRTSANSAQKGANCLTTTFANTPANSYGDWSQTSGANAPAGFGICTLTYGLAFDDNSTVFGNTASEEAKARTVKDYEESIVSEAGQATLFAADYAPVPSALIAISRAGVAEIGWNKAGSGGGGGGGGGSSSTPSAPSGTGGKGAVVSNQFTLTRKAISSKTGGATLSVKLPGAGKLDVLGTAKAGAKKISVGHVVLNAAKGGTFNVTLKPSAAAKKVLKQKGKLNVGLKLTFTPKGGTAKSSTSSLTLKLAKKGR
jgi:ABC-type phosphate transport system substrate-binding protein